MKQLGLVLLCFFYSVFFPFIAEARLLDKSVYYSITSTGSDSVTIQYSDGSYNNDNNEYDFNYRFFMKIQPIDFSGASSFEYYLEICNNCTTTFTLPYPGTKYALTPYVTYDYMYYHTDGNAITSNTILASGTGTKIVTSAGTQPSWGGGSGNSAVDYTTILNNIKAKLAGDTDSLSTQLSTLNSTMITYLNNINTTLSDLNDTLENGLDRIGDILDEKLSSRTPTLSKILSYDHSVTTDTSEFKITLSYLDATQYQVQLDQGSWSGWTNLSSYESTGYIPVSGVSQPGMHIVYVRIRNGTNGKPVEGRMIFFRN